MFAFLGRLARLLASIGIAAVAVQAEGAETNLRSIGAPPGFEQLERSHKMIIDVYYGDKRLGEFFAEVSPGKLRFLSPEQLLAKVPNLKAASDVMAVLAQDMPTHSDLLCNQRSGTECDHLSPEVAGVIFDEDHFRAMLFFNPKMLATVPIIPKTYLRPPDAEASLTTSLGFAVSGSNQTIPFYNLQNRTVMAVGRARIRSEVSLASQMGLGVDGLVGELDRNSSRFSAGLFAAPGLDVTGSRRIAGFGWATQFDTRMDKDVLQGTPIVLFLQQPSRVELLVDGRLVTSGSYPAGNNMVDTSALPDGSYMVVLRIHESNGAVHDQPRFFVKNAHVAPLGQPIYFAYAGMLAQSGSIRTLNLSKTFYYQLGAARRLSRSIAVDISAIGAANKNMVEVGTWVLTPYARLRLAALVSLGGDRAALLQLGSSSKSPIGFIFDLRRVASSDGRPLIPLPMFAENFGSAPPTAAQLGAASYTQMSGAVSYNLGRAYISAMGSFRKDKGLRSDYSIGPDISWPVISRNGLQLTLQANAQRTRTTSAGYVGFRLQYTSKHLSVISTVGEAVRRTPGSPATNLNRTVGSIAAEYSKNISDRTQISVLAGLDRNPDSSDVHAGATVYSQFGRAHADFLHSLGGGNFQYGVSLQSGAALNTHRIALGGRDLEESAIVVSVEGERGSAAFDVIVNDQLRGRVAAGASLPIFLRPYRSYQVRLRSVGSSFVDIDTTARETALYPGNVTSLQWHSRRLFTVFGRALRADGRPLANSAVRSRRGIGETDELGRFQIDVAEGDLLDFDLGGDLACHISTRSAKPQNNYASLGEVVCR